MAKYALCDGMDRYPGEISDLSGCTSPRDPAARLPRSPTALAITLTLSLFGVGACSSDLSEAPERAARPAAPSVDTSALVLNIAVPFSDLAAVANRRLPSSFRDDGHGDDACVEFFGKHCVGTQYEYEVKRNGDFTVTRRDDNRVRIGLEMEANGRGGFRGDVPALLDLDWKRFDATVDARVYLSVGVTEDWCPVATVDADYHWEDNPRVEIVDGVHVRIDGTVEDEMKDLMDSLEDQVERQFRCQDLQGPIHDLWKVYDVPVKIPGALEDAYLRFVPTELAASNMRAEAEQMRLAVGIRGLTSVRLGTPVDTAIGPLPKRIPLVGNKPGILSLSLPLVATYEAMEKAIERAVAADDIPFEIAGDQGSLSIRDVEVYPSVEGLAIGLGIRANLPGRVADTKGRVYLTATPVVGPRGTTVGLQNVRFSRKLTNEIWQVASFVMQDRIRDQIEQQAQMDLRREVALLKEEIAATTRDPVNTGGVAFEVQQPDIRLVGIWPEDEQLLAVVRVDVNLNATVSRSLLEGGM